MGGGGKSKTAEEKALLRLQTRELERTQTEIDEKKRRILRSQIGGRSSLLSGSERGVRPGEVRQMRGASLAGSSGTSTPSARSAPTGFAGRMSAGGGRRSGSLYRAA